MIILYYMYVGMLIFVRHETWTLFLDVEPSDTIKSVKDKIQDKEGIPPDEVLILIFRGQYLEDEQTLFDYGVTKETTLRLKIKMSSRGQ